jgi:hypothetical protein
MKRSLSELLETILNRIHNKPCSFGHEHPTRMCSSCGPFPDPMELLEDHISRELAGVPSPDTPK